MSIHSGIQETSSNALETVQSNSSDLSNSRRSLFELFQQIFSVEQMELCQKQGLLSKNEQQQAHKMAKMLIDQREWPVTSQGWTKLTEWVLMLRDRYSDRLEKQSIRTYNNDRERIEQLDKIQKLSELLEVYGQAHDDLTDLIPALKKLRNEWKNRKKDVESIVLSILSSLSFERARLIRVGRGQLRSLGLGIESLGKPYLVFENGMTQESDRREVINRVARDFSSVFEENASQNLTRMSGSYHRVFQQDAANVIDEIQELGQQIYIGRRGSLQMPTAPVLESGRGVTGTTTTTTTNTTVIGAGPSTSEQERRDSLLVERRQSFNSNSRNNNEVGVTFPFNVSKPVFEPAGWDWPHILKYRLPGHAVSYFCFKIPFHHRQEQHTNRTRNGTWSASVSQMSTHFTKIGYGYYSNMLNNAKLIHVHQAQLFEFASRSLMKYYAALQLEQGCSNLSRALVYLYRLEQDLRNT